MHSLRGTMAREQLGKGVIVIELTGAPYAGTQKEGLW